MMKYLTAAALIAVSGTAIAQNSNNNGDGTAAPKIDATSAMIEGNKITYVSASIDQPGYIVIHNDGAGAPPASLGHLRLQPGMTGDLSIEADGPVDPATNLTLMLHYETNDNDTYDFGPGMTDVDTPVSVGDAVINVPVKAGM